MKKFEISMPLEGEVFGIITAKSEEEAVDIFHENWSKIIQSTDVEEKGKYSFSLTSLEAIERVVDGNVCCVSCSEMHIEEIPLEEE